MPQFHVSNQHQKPRATVRSTPVMPEGIRRPRNAAPAPKTEEEAKVPQVSQEPPSCCSQGPNCNAVREKNASFSDGQLFTDSFGRPVFNDKSSLTVGEDGPTLLQDVYLVEKIAHFDRERIPERVVHAKGTGAFGVFRTTACQKEFTCARFLHGVGTETPVLVRFSTVIGSKGSADTVRDPRGFAVKFYTREGNFDLVGNDLPVFFIRDAIQFPDVIHSLKPSPDTNLPDPQRFWDFISLTPEATHMITWLYSDRGTIKSYRHVDGFGVNTFVWVNEDGKRTYVKYHWKTRQGIETIDRCEALRLAGEDPDVAVRDLRNAINEGNFPSYELLVQLMDPAVAETLPFDPLDDTKTWPEDQFPLQPVGVMTLNRNPENFFAQVEQSAFCPANLVPGMEFSADKMLTGRSFSYTDTQRYRLGINFSQLPVNSPAVKVANYQQDGLMRYSFNEGSVNYHPNSLADNTPVTHPDRFQPGPRVCGTVQRTNYAKGSDFEQAGQRYRSLSASERHALCDNIAVELACCNEEIVSRLIGYFTQADAEFGHNVRELTDRYKNRR